ncbi:histone-like nucleoid-structuring protein Lsr2 [Krasilnikovia sp. MM14-A1259]|uniref:histone-like nucleoid-structuring protein Lsr2 n=1 Tax=Krasilnikovia sp. MM14-A1259 TaxID=3373539 RepID=UPI0038169959
MARRVITTLIDDLDGKKADRTVEFSLDGMHYTIDLSETNAGKLRKALDPYIAAGTRVGRGGSGRAVGRSGRTLAGGRTASSRDENRLIRDWAQRHGHQISERGRIPSSVTTAYHQAHAG